MRLQQGVLAGVPTTTCTISFSKLAQTPNFRVSLGQLTGLVDGGDFGDEGFDGGDFGVEGFDGVFIGGCLGVILFFGGGGHGT